MIRFFKEKPPVIQQSEKLGFKTFKNHFDLNIIACRNEKVDNQFRDTLHVVYWKDNKWVEYIFSCSTIPGRYWIDNVTRKDGVAILKHNHQYRSAFTFGTHKGTYSCLVTSSPIEVWRDNDKGDLDFDEVSSLSYGIQIHKAGYESSQINKWSAGCLVLQTGFDTFMKLCNQQKAAGHGSKFSLTILKGIYL